MKAVMRTFAEQDVLLVIRALVEVVAEFVVNGLKVLRVDLRAHLDAQIVDAIDVPRGSMTDDVTVVRLLDQRALPKRLRQRLEAERREERLAGLDHSTRREALLVQHARQIDTG